MKINLAFPKTVILCGLAAAAVPASLSAQQQYPYTATEAQTDLTVNGTLPADLSELPEGPWSPYVSSLFPCPGALNVVAAGGRPAYLRNS